MLKMYSENISPKHPFLRELKGLFATINSRNWGYLQQYMICKIFSIFPHYSHDIPTIYAYYLNAFATKDSKGTLKEDFPSLHLHPPRAYTCRLPGTTRVGSRDCKQGGGAGCSNRDTLVVDWRRNPKSQKRPHIYIDV